MNTFHLTIKRFHPETGSSLQTFSVPTTPEMTVLDALQLVKNAYDGSLAFRWSCRMGICGSCGMMVNGRPMLTCQTRVADFPKRTMVIEPLRHFPVLRDLIVDISDPMEKFRSVMPWVFPKEGQNISDGPTKQTPRERAKIDQTSQCIKCMLCYSACPVYGLDPKFLGPAAGALAYRYQADSRDTAQRERAIALSGKDGVFSCSFVGECSVVCPKRVDPALALQRLKIMGLRYLFTGP